MINPAWGHAAGAITVVLMVTFICIWIWAWSKRHRGTFQRLAELPMQDKPEGPLPGRSDDNSKGDRA